MKEAIFQEDIKTLEYMKKHGPKNVRGGRYSGSDYRVEKKSKVHLKRVYITILHYLCTECGISISELQKRNLY